MDMRRMALLLLTFPLYQAYVTGVQYTAAVNTPRHKMRAVSLYGVDITAHMLGSPYVLYRKVYGRIS